MLEVRQVFGDPQTFQKSPKLSRIIPNFPNRGNVGAVSNFWENEEDGQANYDR